MPPTRARSLTPALAGLLAAAVTATLTLVYLAATAPTAQADAHVIVVSSDFEDGTTQGWSPRADETVTATAAAARTGEFGLAVSGRTRTWEGPTLDLLDTLQFGRTYQFSAWVRLAPGEPTSGLRMSVERQWQGEPSFDQVVGATTVTAGDWVQLVGSYRLAHDVDFLTVYLEADSDTVSFYVDDVVVSFLPPLPIQTDLPDLHDVLAPYFPVGAAIERPQIIGEHAELLVKHFNSVTPGNQLKWDATQPAPGEFRFTDADALVDFARQHGWEIRGHTLVWHNQTPAWVFQDATGAPLTPTEEHRALLLGRLEEHIRSVAGRYADDIAAWDVVNEVIDENQPDGMRRSQWYEITGLDYIRTAFEVAREVAPQAKLFINDYNTNVPAKREALFELVSQLRAEGVPIDGVGHQMHINIEWPSVAETEQMLQRFIPLGVDQQITELDLSIYVDAEESFPTPPPERLIQQGHRYHAMFDLFRQYAEHLSSVTLWGLADDDTWLDSFPVTRKDAPLLFDTRLQAKPAYWGIVDPAFIENPPTQSPSPSPTDPSPTASPTAPPEEAGCLVAYEVVNQWSGGFQSAVTITNTGPAPVEGWELSWSFPAGQTVTQVWNGRLDPPAGPVVTVRHAAWNPTIAPGTGVEFGFLGGWQESNPPPDAFRLNGASCAVDYGG